MRFNTLRAAVGAAIVALALSACSGKSSHEEASSPEADQQRSEIYEAMKSGDLQRMEAVADSLSLMTDDLTTDETVAVLLAFLQVHNEAAKARNTKKDLVTIRKFVDVYDIAVSRQGDQLVNAFNSAKELNSNVDLPEIAREMRERLADYDALSGEEPPKPAEPKEEKADSTATTGADQPVQPAE